MTLQLLLLLLIIAVSFGNETSDDVFGATVGAVAVGAVAVL